jgi:hypothetical protein
VIECLADALAREATQAPHQHCVELAPRTGVHHGSELRPVPFALGSALPVLILGDDAPLHGLGKGQQLFALIFRGLLASILRALVETRRYKATRSEVWGMAGVYYNHLKAMREVLYLQRR